ncbi:hypothetical protein BX666DRAFT_1651217 [Dichotomocladium elegans]|nr:hypothetical protein BX666DRAFT_1651217 [Dichotomocladium elegans]
MIPRSIADTTPDLQEKLKSAGYESITDIKESGVLEVIRELQLSPQQTTDLLALVQGGPLQTSHNVQEQLLVERQRTEGGLFSIRLRAMATALQERLGASAPDVETLLDGVHIFRVYDHYELVALIRQLSTILTEKPRIKLIVLDTITFPLRLNIQNMRLRNGLLNFIGHSLVQLANKHEVSIVVNNQVTSDRINSALTPAFGAVWGHWCSNRIFLHRKRDRR